MTSVSYQGHSAGAKGAYMKPAVVASPERSLCQMLTSEMKGESGHQQTSKKRRDSGKIPRGEV
jgi:hypothetical protein